MRSLLKGNDLMTWDTPASQPSWDSQPSYQPPALRLASSQHRIGSWALDTVLISLTFGIGWLIWSLFTWKTGQSPAKKILKIRVFHVETSQPVTWGHMAIYEFLCNLTLNLAAALIYTMTFGLLGPLPFLALWLIDFCWYWKDGKRRTIRDNVAKVVVVNIA